MLLNETGELRVRVSMLPGSSFSNELPLKTFFSCCLTVTRARSYPYHRGKPETELVLSEPHQQEAELGWNPVSGLCVIPSSTVPWVSTSPEHEFGKMKSSLRLFYLQMS